MELNELSIAAAHDGLAKRKFSSKEITQSCLDQIAQHDKKVAAFLNVDAEGALAQAADADGRIAAGTPGALCGIPIALKDLILQKGTVTTGGSKILEKYTATYDATVVSKLAETRAVFIGKTNLDEFAMGSSTENSAFQKTKNPWNLERVPGGSSGGSAAAVAADMCLGALGTDTGGSVRQPASLCGIVGLKPTYGSVSRYGIIAMASSLDQVGPMAKTVRDAALLFNVIAGKDAHDSTTVKLKPVDLEALERGINGIAIGIPDEYFIEGMDAGVQESVERAIEKLRELGARVSTVSLPLTRYALAVYQLTMTSEVSTNLARYDGIRYGHSAVSGAGTPPADLIEVYRKSKAAGFGDEAKRRIILGTFALSAGYHDQYYVKAQQVRKMIEREFTDVFKSVDCLITPTSPSVAFKVGERYADPLTMYLSDIYTVPANMGNICGISVPCGFVGGLPVGLQVLAKPFDEATLFRVARAYEQATEWHARRPQLN
ncbi:MAG: Asp-tRNA(Asn)/Glu-tRNA(Gln) amidotransferase subunit GatA [Patescibacteria group bacterium]